MSRTSRLSFARAQNAVSVSFPCSRRRLIGPMVKTHSFGQFFPLRSKRSLRFHRPDPPSRQPLTRLHHKDARCAVTFQREKTRRSIGVLAYQSVCMTRLRSVSQWDTVGEFSHSRAGGNPALALDIFDLRGCDSAKSNGRRIGYWSINRHTLQTTWDLGRTKLLCRQRGPFKCAPLGLPYFESLFTHHLSHPARIVAFQFRYHLAA